MHATACAGTGRTEEEADQAYSRLCGALITASGGRVGDVGVVWSFFFFFQAEDGIRDLTVTGVQTCALPISRSDRARTNLRIGGCDDAKEAAVGTAARLDRPVGRQPAAGAAPADGRLQAHHLAWNDARNAGREARAERCLEGLLSSLRTEPGGCVRLRPRGPGRGIDVRAHQDRNPAPAEGTVVGALAAPIED